MVDDVSKFTNRSATTAQISHIPESSIRSSVHGLCFLPVHVFALGLGLVAGALLAKEIANNQLWQESALSDLSCSGL